MKVFYVLYFRIEVPSRFYSPKIILLTKMLCWEGKEDDLVKSRWPDFPSYCNMLLCFRLALVETLLL